MPTRSLAATIGRIDRIDGTEDVKVIIQRHDTNHEFRISFDKLDALLTAYSQNRNIRLTADPGKFLFRSG